MFQRSSPDEASNRKLKPAGNRTSREGGKRPIQAPLLKDPERTPADSSPITGWSMKPAGVRSGLSLVGA
jgi:hypothetical protein